jgi:hypothetical protein
MVATDGSEPERGSGCRYIVPCDEMVRLTPVMLILL